MSNTIWKQDFSLEGLNAMSTNTMLSQLGIVFCDFGPDYLMAQMPVDARTVQPMRILHGGASVALAETVGSVASLLCLEDLETQEAVGLEINASHLRSVLEGSIVQALCRPIKLGNTVHIWQIEIAEPKALPNCIVRLSMMLRNRRKL